MGWVVHSNPSNVEEWWLKATFLKTTPTPTSNKVCQTLPNTHFFFLAFSHSAKSQDFCPLNLPAPCPLSVFPHPNFIRLRMDLITPITTSFFSWATSQDTSLPPKPPGSIRGDEAESNPSVYMSQLVKHHHSPSHPWCAPALLSRPPVTCSAQTLTLIHTRTQENDASLATKWTGAAFLLRLAVYFINLSLSPLLPCFNNFSLFFFFLQQQSIFITPPCESS